MAEMIDLNKADVKDLEKIIHIGPKRAAMMLTLRPFMDIYEISRIDRLGKKRVDDILAQGIIEVG